MGSDTTLTRFLITGPLLKPATHVSRVHVEYIKKKCRGAIDLHNGVGEVVMNVAFDK